MTLLGLFLRASSLGYSFGKRGKSHLQKVAVEMSSKREGRDQCNCHEVLSSVLWKMSCVRWREMERDALHPDSLFGSVGRQQDDKV